MIKKSLKYLAIVFINFILLFLMLDFWVDAFELEFKHDLVFFEILSLIGISLLALIVLGITVVIYRSWNIKSLKKKMSISILSVLLISSNFYISYGKKIYQNQFVNHELRKSIMHKIKPYEGSWFGNKAEHLTLKEYTEITKVKWFPELPQEAENISYDYEYEGFLPDYSFSLSYDVPFHTKVDTLNYKEGTFSKSRSFEIVGTIKRVTYYESQW